MKIVSNFSILDYNLLFQILLIIKESVIRLFPIKMLNLIYTSKKLVILI